MVNNLIQFKGITTAYNKAGRMICKHPTKLPGGNRDSKTGNFYNN